MDWTTEAAGDEEPSSRRLFYYSGGFLREHRLRRMLALAGWELKLGLPRPEDHVAVWGNSPTAHRGRRVAETRGATLLHVEDAFLRSVTPGRAGSAPLGLLLDDKAPHFDPKTPSRLEDILTNDPLDDHTLLSRSRDGMDRIKLAQLSKYNDFPLDTDLPRAPYVLVIDQTQGDAAVTASGATGQTFREMLIIAQEENPGVRVVIKTHPETHAGFRPGYYGPEHAVGKVSLLTDPVSPQALLEGAVAVYTVSSTMGFEAIIAGHRPRVFGQPFYGGWGLTKDENPVPRRTRALTRAQLFGATMIRYPIWYDPYSGGLGQLEDVLGALEAQARATREDKRGYVAVGMRLWKRKTISDVFGAGAGVRFAKAGAAPALAEKRDADLMVWASKADTLSAPAIRVEDGFIRSKGLGATLTPPMSLVRDHLGIYFDPSSDSRLEHLIAASTALPPGARHRAERLLERLIQTGISKYNLEADPLPDLPEGRRILVPGQVEDDASITKGAGEVRDNLSLLQTARVANPTAVLIYKPHPDVEAGLRTSGMGTDEAAAIADVVVTQGNSTALIEAVDAVWTMTSLMGFEALIRGKDVTCLGAPFYAGWGLTRDLGKVPARRQARPDLTALAHAVLIDYPRYYDPQTGLACPVEVVLDRLETGHSIPRSRALRQLSKLQGLFAGWAHLWR